jgi:hypothetical protein
MRWALISLPFIAFFILIVLVDGWKAAFIVFGGVGFMYACLYSGIHLEQFIK